LRKLNTRMPIIVFRIIAIKIEIKINSTSTGINATYAECFTLECDVDLRLNPPFQRVATDSNCAKN
jgi:hypothetical protein